MDHFDFDEMMDLFAEIEAAGSDERMASLGLAELPGDLDSTDRQEESSAETLTPMQIGTPLSESPPLLPLPSEPTYSISNTFNPELAMGGQTPNVVLLSTDCVLFYTHTSSLLAESKKQFNALLSPDVLENIKRTKSSGPPWLIMMPEDSALLNIVIHNVYKMRCDQFNPLLKTLLDAVGALKTYGTPVHHFLYRHIISETPRSPMDVYLVAAENNLETFAVTSSAQLLSLSLPSITDEMVKRMGSLYFKRLVTLHIQREQSLKHLLQDPPAQHPETAACGAVESQRLTGAWMFTVATMLGDLRPVGLLGRTFGALKEEEGCDVCKGSQSESTTNRPGLVDDSQTHHLGGDSTWHPVTRHTMTLSILTN
ncbi:hypothetical protein BXZ70DRAFT_506481 [Cristinia sonorae]|uniref:BTB domain-containing protein n=1 Tax=Cristinia sonorae TaxID=1940300 RepID=A0A8K0UW10_9AGAR|nr:hypothetical protein BXZ70DRAFT_506481 [Cristinia sonorae]